MKLKYSSVLIFVLYLLFDSVSSKEFILDKESDLSREFIHNDCYYSQNYEDFWVWGCGTSNFPVVGPAITAGGYWGTCQKECEIIFNTGIYPHALSIKVEGFISGSSEIQIFGTRSSFNLSIWDPIDSIPANPTWFSQTIDTTEYNETFVYSVKPIGSLDGFVLIDRIVIDVGDDDLPPTTTTTTTTTPKPPAQTGIVSLDVQNDNPKFWHDVACHYSPHFTDFDFAWGCPTNIPVIQDDRAGGYWTVCKKEVCHMDYYGTILAAPTAIQLSTHIKGDAQIHVFGKRGKLDTTEQHLYTISVHHSDNNSNERFCNRVHLLPISYLFSDIYAITVKLVSAENGFVLLDKAAVVLTESTLGESPVETSNIVGTAICKIDISPEIRTTTTTTTTTTPNPNGAVSKNKNSNFFILLLVLMIPAIKSLVL